MFYLFDKEMAKVDEVNKLGKFCLFRPANLRLSLSSIFSFSS